MFRKVINNHVEVIGLHWGHYSKTNTLYTLEYDAACFWVSLGKLYIIGLQINTQKKYNSLS